MPASLPANIVSILVGTTATQILQSLGYDRDLQIAQAAGGGIVYIGFHSGVRSTTGWPLTANRAPFLVRLPAGQSLWAIGTVTSDRIAVWEVFGQD